MAQTVVITLTTTGADTGPFSLYSNVDGFLSPFETGVAKVDLEAGYTSYLVPDAALVIRVQSTGVLCNNYVDLVIGTTTTSTSTSSTSTTTTTTTTLAPEDYDFYLADQYLCVDCVLQTTNVVVCFPTGTSVTIGNYYTSLVAGDYNYRITGTTSPAIATILTTVGNNALCSSVPCIV